jgi:hypothetical protein
LDYPSITATQVPTNGLASSPAIAFGKEVALQTYRKDKYGRTLADVLLPDGTNDALPNQVKASSF